MKVEIVLICNKNDYTTYYHVHICYLYNIIKQDIGICIVCICCIKPAKRLDWLGWFFLWTLMGGREAWKATKNSNFYFKIVIYSNFFPQIIFQFFFKIIFFHGQRRALHLVKYIDQWLQVANYYSFWFFFCKYFLSGSKFGIALLKLLHFLPTHTVLMFLKFLNIFLYCVMPFWPWEKNCWFFFFKFLW